MSESAAIRGIVLGHGAMPQGLVDAVRHIAGDAADALVPVSNREVTPDALRALVDEAAGTGPAVIFADLGSGSCGVAAAYSCRDRGERAFVCGVNLPMLLDFVFHTDLPLEELVERLLEKGRTAIRATTPAG